MGMKYKDKSYTVEERVDDLIGRMTLEEKIGQMMQISFISVSTEEAEVDNQAVRRFIPACARR